MLIPFFFPDKQLTLSYYRNSIILSTAGTFDKILVLAASNLILLRSGANFYSSGTVFSRYWFRLYTTLTQNYFKRTMLLHQVRLRLVGSGFFAQKDTEHTILLHLGFSHVIEIAVAPPLFIKVEGRKQKLLHCWSTDPESLAGFVWTIRNLKRPDCYKGKGVRYVKESLRLKKGKKKFV